MNYEETYRNFDEEYRNFDEEYKKLYAAAAQTGRTLREQIEALKLALEALENLRPEGYWNKAITAIKEALAQTQEPKIGCVNHDCDKCKAQTQEPVAWLEPEWGEEICPEVGFEATTTSDHPRDLCWIPLYPHPPQRTWVGLTDEEENEYNYLGPDMHWVIQEIAAKLKEKNT